MCWFINVSSLIHSKTLKVLIFVNSEFFRHCSPKWPFSPLKALVWFWLIDETLILTSMLSVWIRWGWYNPSDGAKKIMVHGDDQEMIKCSTWKRRKRKIKPNGDQDKGIV
jgi:hypothetical protein